jgi:hypothetical protein
MDQVAESRRTRRVKEGIGSLPSISAAFGPACPIYLRNPGGHLCAGGIRRQEEADTARQVLAEMEQVVPWTRQVECLTQLYPKSERGRPLIGLERI